MHRGEEGDLTFEFLQGIGRRVIGDQNPSKVMSQYQETLINDINHLVGLA
jgi:hypothetical protein